MSLTSERSNQPIAFVSSCSQFKECQNNQCFFRRRDHFGLSPWASAYMEQYEGSKEMNEKWNEVNKEYGQQIFPELIASIGTNCIYITCKDFK